MRASARMRSAAQRAAAAASGGRRPAALRAACHAPNATGAYGPHPATAASACGDPKPAPESGTPVSQPRSLFKDLCARPRRGTAAGSRPRRERSCTHDHAGTLSRDHSSKTSVRGPAESLSNPHRGPHCPQVSNPRFEIQSCHQQLFRAVSKGFWICHPWTKPRTSLSPCASAASVKDQTHNGASDSTDTCGVGTVSSGQECAALHRTTIPMSA